MTSIHIIAMISERGASRIILFSENLNSVVFIRFMGLLKQDADDLYPRGNYRLYMDNDPKHRSKKTRDWLKENGINAPNDWPSSSPDINPIENVWGLVARSIQKYYPKTIGDLRKQLRSAWRRIATPALCQSLIASMPNRLAQVLGKQGEKIDY